MAFTINISYSPGDTVFQVTTDEGIREATVFKTSSETTATEQEVRHQLIYKGQIAPAPLLVVESNIYDTLTSALIAYEAILI